MHLCRFLLSGLNFRRSLSECLGRGCCTPGTTTAVVLNQGSCGLGGGLRRGLPPPPTGMFPAIGIPLESEELPKLDDLGLSGGDSGGEGVWSKPPTEVNLLAVFVRGISL